MASEFNIDGLTAEQSEQVRSLIEQTIQDTEARIRAEIQDKPTSKAPEVPYLPRPLSRYKIGDRVEVLNRYSWTPGEVVSSNKWGLSIETAMGPVTVASYHRIRPASE